MGGWSGRGTYGSLADDWSSRISRFPITQWHSNFQVMQEQTQKQRIFESSSRTDHSRWVFTSLTQISLPLTAGIAKTQFLSKLQDDWNLTWAHSPRREHKIRDVRAQAQSPKPSPAQPGLSPFSGGLWAGLMIFQSLSPGFWRSIASPFLAC
jgi:hypothetical protein